MEAPAYEYKLARAAYSAELSDLGGRGWRVVPGTIVRDSGTTKVLMERELNASVV